MSRAPWILQPGDEVKLRVLRRDAWFYTLTGVYVKPSGYVQTEHLIRVLVQDVESIMRDREVTDLWRIRWSRRREFYDPGVGDCGEVWMREEELDVKDAVTRLGDLGRTTS